MLQIARPVTSDVREGKWENDDKSNQPSGECQSDRRYIIPYRATDYKIARPQQGREGKHCNQRGYGIISLSR